MEYENRMKLEFDSRSANEGFARVAVAAFLSQMNPTLEEVADVKTALSEAVTNCVVHAYEGKVEKITRLIFPETQKAGADMETTLYLVEMTYPMYATPFQWPWN